MQATKRNVSYKTEPEPSISPDRIRHMHGVAELMREYAGVFKCRTLDRDGCYLLGLLHDIGYMHTKEGHEAAGSAFIGRYLKDGSDNMIAHCIRWHGAAPSEYTETNHCTDSDIPPELILLWWADLLVESEGPHAGEAVGYPKRLAGIIERYGEESHPFRSARETMLWLSDYMSKILEEAYNAQA